MEELIPNDESVRLLSHLLEELDYSSIYKVCSHIERNHVIAPKMMFKILIYAYYQMIYSSSKIEQVFRRDINFLWLLAGNKAPDHSTISRFFTLVLRGICEDLFRQLCQLLLKTGEVSGKNLFVDGTKIESRANKYAFVWKKSVAKYEVRMQAKLFEQVAQRNHEHIQSIGFCAETAAGERIIGPISRKSTN